MKNSTIEKISFEAGRLDFQNYHCSEAFILVVGEYLLGEVDPTLRKISTAFGGGYGKTREEACGALSAGVLLIGALYGRLSNDEDDTVCFQLVEQYRDRFVAEFGASRCKDLREKGYGSTDMPCAVLIEGGSRMLLQNLEEHKATMK